MYAYVISVVCRLKFLKMTAFLPLRYNAMLFGIDNILCKVIQAISNEDPWFYKNSFKIFFSQ